MRRYDLSAIMKRAWKNFRKSDSKISFGEALHRSWISAKAETVNEMRIQAAKDAAGVQEATDTWSGWRKAGFEVAHGSKALFQAVLIWGSKGDGKSYTASFFGASQVQAANS